MNRDRLWVIGLGAAIVVVAALGYLAGISPIVAQASAADAQRTSIAAANDASAARLISLKAQYAGIAKLQAQLKVLAGSIPADAEMPVFLRELNALSNQYQVSLKSVAVSVAQNYASPTVTPVKPPAGSAATPSPSPSPSTSTSTGAGAGTPAATSAPASRLILIPVAISISGSYSNLMAFVGGLQSGDRLYLLTGLSMSSAADAAHFSADITGYVYALPPAGGTVAKTPAPSGTTTPAPGVSSSATPTPDPSSSPTP
ncbi:MAG: hypothetical protein JWN09_1981 [Microbacteriaceae bacterium]|nr:hypothetical protein [Microbacteriaceae bacterium]